MLDDAQEQSQLILRCPFAPSFASPGRALKPTTASRLAVSPLFLSRLIVCGCRLLLGNPFTACLLDGREGEWEEIIVCIL